MAEVKEGQIVPKNPEWVGHPGELGQYFEFVAYIR